MVEDLVGSRFAGPFDPGRVRSAPDRAVAPLTSEYRLFTW